MTVQMNPYEQSYPPSLWAPVAAPTAKRGRVKATPAPVVVEADEADDVDEADDDG